MVATLDSLDIEPGVWLEMEGTHPPTWEIHMGGCKGRVLSWGVTWTAEIWVTLWGPWTEIGNGPVGTLQAAQGLVELALVQLELGRE